MPRVPRIACQERGGQNSSNAQTIILLSGSKGSKYPERLSAPDFRWPDRASAIGERLNLQICWSRSRRSKLPECPNSQIVVQIKGVNNSRAPEPPSIFWRAPGSTIQERPNSKFACPDRGSPNFQNAQTSVVCQDRRNQEIQSGRTP